MIRQFWRNLTGADVWEALNNQILWLRRELTQRDAIIVEGRAVNKRQQDALDELRPKLFEAEKRRDVAEQAARSARDAATLLADRALVGEVERNQLGLRKLPNDIAGALAMGDNDRATEAKFRTLKRTLRSHMVMVDTLTGELETIGRANVVTKTDIERLRELRDRLRELRAQGLEFKELGNAVPT